MKITEKVGVLSIMLLLLVFIVLVGSSLAFFSPGIQGNTNAKTITLSANETTIRLKTDQGTSGLDVGDVINIYKDGCFSEDFYVVSTNSTKTVLLAKYNLYVGRIYNTSNSTYTEIQSSASGYGLQNSTAKGYVSGNTQRIGVVPFSGSSGDYGYWDPSNSGINSTYGTYTNYANNVYDTDYVTAPNYSVAFNSNAGNVNYSIAYYVEEYVDKLGIDGMGRLLTYGEEQSLASSNNSIIFNGTTYWLGSARHSSSAWRVSSDGGLGSNYFYISYYSGVRPVIEINTADIEPMFKSVGTDTTTGLPVVRLSGTKEEFYDITNAVDYSTLVSTNGNIYNYASDKSILLARYNLYVGRIYKNSTYTEILTSASGYGLQSEDAKGYIDSSSPTIGIVPFSGSSDSNGYWYDSANNTIYSKYGTSYNKSNIYDTDYTSAPNYSVAFKNNVGNANYSIAYYAEEYVNRLGIDGTGRLLTYTEGNAMTQAQRKNGANYWLGSATGSSSAWVLNREGSWTNGTFSGYSSYGVRPVLVVSTSTIGS